MKCKNKARYPLHHKTKDKCYCYRKKYRDNHNQCLVGIEQVHNIHIGTTAEHLYYCHNEGSTKQLEHKRHGGWCGQAKRVEEVEQKDIADDHRQVDAHNLTETEILRSEDSVARHVHHTAAESRAYEYT